MDNDQSKKCFCARCFHHIETEDKVDIEGQNFHRICSMCCVCRNIPTSIKMFYGHVFCSECFKSHVLSRFRGHPTMESSSWWGQPVSGEASDGTKESKPCDGNADHKKYICSRCLVPVEEHDKVDIEGQHFHPLCAKCCCCQSVPKTNLKIYYGQVFCEGCFSQHVMNPKHDNPSEFFRTCFEQFQNPQFAENMRQFMDSGKESRPFVFCRCSGGCEWTQPDAGKSANDLTEEGSIATWDLSFENRTELSDISESCPTIEENQRTVAEKIEKLTKYLHDQRPQVGKKWKNFVESDRSPAVSYGWVDLQVKCFASLDGKLGCPKCLWQCGPIYTE